MELRKALLWVIRAYLELAKVLLVGHVHTTSAIRFYMMSSADEIVTENQDLQKETIK